MSWPNWVLSKQQLDLIARYSRAVVALKPTAFVAMIWREISDDESEAKDEQFVTIWDVLKYKLSHQELTLSEKQLDYVSCAKHFYDHAGSLFAKKVVRTPGPYVSPQQHSLSKDCRTFSTIGAMKHPSAMWATAARLKPWETYSSLVRSVYYIL